MKRLLIGVTILVLLVSCSGDSVYKAYDGPVITSYSIHYTKLYECTGTDRLCVGSGETQPETEAKHNCP